MKRLHSASLPRVQTWQWLATIGFGVLTLLRVLGHSMWRDELQAWSLASSSGSLGELMGNMRCEGTPALWHVCLYALTRLTTNPVAMQLFHVAIATVSAHLILRVTEVRVWIRVLLLLGYFFSYEYAVISRNYAMGVLLLALLCAELVTKKRSAVVGLLAFLAMQTSFHAALVILSLAFVLLWRGLSEQKRRWQWLVPPALGVGLGTVVLLAQVAPGGECRDAGGEWTKTPAAAWTLRLELPRFWHAGSTLWRSYAPIPQIDLHFWNTALLHPHHVLETVLGLLLFVAFAFSLWRWRALLTSYVIGTFGIVAFSYVRYFGGSRHHGHLFLLLCACCWLATAAENASPRAGDRWRRGVRFVAFASILVLQLPGSIISAAAEHRLPFSSSAAVADALRARGVGAERVIGAPDIQTSAVAGYLRRPLYYPTSASEGTFIMWDTSRKYPEDGATVERLAADEARRSGKPALVLTNGHMPLSVMSLKQVAAFDECIVEDECFFLYVREP